MKILRRPSCIHSNDNPQCYDLKNKQYKKNPHPKPTTNESSFKNISSMCFMSIVVYLGLYKNDKSSAWH